jgi:lipopolysaccharide transport system permease protein
VLGLLNPLHMAGRLWTHRGLIRQLTQREIEGRYRGSALGLLWSLVSPLSLLLTYTFAFGVIFKGRWPESANGNLAEFSLALFCGLIVINVFAECVNRASTLIVSVPNYVKKVVFPIEVLPLSVAGAALFHALASLSVLILVNWLVNGRVHGTILLLPAVWLPLVFLSLGLMWLLASLGVFLRDISYLVTLLLQVLLFATPVFYPLSVVPQPFRAFLRLNPLAAIVEDFRGIALWGTWPHWGALGFSTLVSLVVMLLGYAWFMMTRKAFADVL